MHVHPVLSVPEDQSENGAGLSAYSAINSLPSAHEYITLLHYFPMKSLRTSQPGELRLAPHAPSLGWHAFFIIDTSQFLH